MKRIMHGKKGLGLTGVIIIILIVILAIASYKIYKYLNSLP
ncbi:MAG: hypothetical protein WC916_07080 [Candidatus Woesearchaeota archaeon]